MVDPPAATPLRGQTVKVAWIDPLSGLMAQRGYNELHAFMLMTDYFNAWNPAGVHYELRAFDNHLSQETARDALHQAMQWGARYVVQGIGDGVTQTLHDGVEDYNREHAGHEVLFIDYGTAATEFGNQRCGYWQFRVEPDVAMRAEVAAAYLQARPELKKIFLVNPDYALGRQAHRASVEALARHRPDLQIVGEAYLPLASDAQAVQAVAQSIRDAGADAVLSSNWGSDLTLLLQALQAGSMPPPVFAFFAHWSSSGLSPQAGRDMALYQVMDAAVGSGSPFTAGVRDAMARQYQEPWFSAAAFLTYQLMTQSMLAAGSSEPAAVAHSLEGLHVSGLDGDVVMGRDDHQLRQDLWMSRAHTVLLSGPRRHVVTQWTFAPVQRFDAYVSALPTTCQMTRP